MPDGERSAARTPARHGRASPAQLRDLARRVALLGTIVAALLVLGALGLVLAEGVGAWYAFRWALDTVATVGGFPQPHTLVGQSILVLLIVLGVGTLFYALATLTEFFVGGQLGEVFAARREQTMIDALTGHYIICGFGRVGRQVARDLRAARAEYIVVDSEPENRELAESMNIHFIEGDSSRDAVLRQAGLERARADRLRGLRPGEHLHHSDRARAAPRYHDHRAGSA
jgi:voltage-gated potassium channel